MSKTPSICYNDREARWIKRYREGRAPSSSVVNITVPDDIERRSVHEPCFYCGTALGLCRHRIAA